MPWKLEYDVTLHEKTTPCNIPARIDLKINDYSKKKEAMKEAKDHWEGSANIPWTIGRSNPRIVWVEPLQF